MQNLMFLWLKKAIGTKTKRFSPQVLPQEVLNQETLNLQIFVTIIQSH